MVTAPAPSSPPHDPDLAAVIGPARLTYYTPVHEQPTLADRKAFLDHFRTLAPDLQNNPVVDAVRTGEVKWCCSIEHLA